MNPDQIGQKYNKIATWWNENHLNSNYGLPQIERAIAFTKNKECALDVGCGSGGRIIRLLNAHHFQVTGVDVSEKMIEIAQRNHPESDFHFASIDKWESSQLFDLIIAWDSIFHIEASRQSGIIKLLTQKLRPHGILIYTLGDNRYHRL